MKLGSIMIVLLAIVSLEINGQQQLNRDPQNIVDPTGIMRILTPPTEVEGSADMFEDWQQGEIYLAKGKQPSVLDVNYDILNHIVAVQVKGKEYSLNPLAIDSIVLQNNHRVLVNTRILTGISGDALLLRIFEGSNYTVYRKTVVEIIKPNYNELLHVGSRNYQIDQDNIYLIRDKKKDTYVEVKAKKDFKKLPNYDKISKYIKKEHLNTKEESDLIEVVKYCDQLTN